MGLMPCACRWTIYSVIGPTWSRVLWPGISNRGMDCLCPIGSGSGVSPDGVPAFLARHCVVAGSDRTKRSAHNLPDHGLQPLLKRFFRCLGKVAPDGACLRQLY